MIYTLMSIYLFAHATTSAPGGCSLSLSPCLAFLKADLYDMCVKRQTVAVVLADGRYAAAAGFQRGGHETSGAAHRSKSLFLRCVGNKYDEGKQVCMTQACRLFLNLQGRWFFFVRGAKLPGKTSKKRSQPMLLF